MANYNPDFNNTFLFPSTSIAYSPFSSSSSSSLPSYYPSSPSETSASQSSSSLPLLPSQPSSSSVHPYAAAAPAPVSSAACADDGTFGATNIAKSPQDIAPGAEPDIDLRDWRVHLQPDSRQGIVDKIAKTLKRHLPFSSEEGLLERKKIAVRFEEEIYDAATSQSDYLRKTSLKMLKMDMETIAQDDVANSAQSNSSVCSNELQVQENLMDSSNSRYTAPGGEPAIDMCDWRVHLQHDTRQKVVNTIMGTLKRNLPFCGEEGLLELKKIAERFEEKIYVSAISQSDYLRKIGLRMLTMETKPKNSVPN